MLEEIIICLFGIIQDLLTINRGELPRQLLNAAWSFERQAFSLWSETLRIDTQANKNVLRRYIINLLGYDGNGNSIRVSGGMLQNQRLRSFIVYTAKLLPRILSRRALRAVRFGLTDDSKEEQGGFLVAKQYGVLSPAFILFLCNFHRITQKLRDPAHFGSAYITPTAYDRILATLQVIARSCETRREAMMIVNCLLAYGRKTLRPSKMQQLISFVDACVGSFSQWALFTVICVLTMGLFTTSAVEGLHSIVARSEEKGGWGLTASHDCHAIVDKGEETTRARRAEKELKTHRWASTRNSFVSAPLKDADIYLQPVMRKALERIFQRANKVHVTFYERQGDVGVHWQVADPANRGSGASSRPGSVGPRFLRIRIIVLCKHCDGHYFLLCTCFLYQRELYICEHIAAVKRLFFDVFADVHFRYHLVYALTGLATASGRTRTDGQFDGPGIKGVLKKDVAIAIEDMPDGRDGVGAWLQEGGLAWVPKSTPVWGIVSEALYMQELAIRHGEQNEDTTDRTETFVQNEDVGLATHSLTVGMGHDGEHVPIWVQKGNHFYTFYMSYMRERASHQATYAGRADFLQMMRYTRATMDDQDSALENFDAAPRLPSPDCLDMHDNTRCDSCQATPIVGARFKCTICANTEFCATCGAKDLHPADHPLLKSG